MKPVNRLLFLQRNDSTVKWGRNCCCFRLISPRCTLEKFKERYSSVVPTFSLYSSKQYIVAVHNCKFEMLDIRRMMEHRGLCHQDL